MITFSVPVNLLIIKLLEISANPTRILAYIVNETLPAALLEIIRDQIL